jgi:cytochrome c oxidase subunit I
MEKTALNRGIRLRIFSTNHRVIARQYFFLSLAAVLLGTALSLLMRFHRIYPQNFHLIMGIAALFGILAATFYWFPLMFGRMMDERLGKLHFYLTFTGAYATFLPMHFAGNPRR